MNNNVIKLILCGFLTLTLFSNHALSDNGNAKSQSDVVAQVQSDVDEKIADKTSEKRKKLIQEGIEAINNVASVLNELDDGNVDKAMDKLELATGQIDLLVARDPDLGLVPIDVSEKSIDVIADEKLVNQLRKETIEALKDKDIVTARKLLNGLASELQIITTSIPLATFPQGIKSVAPLIEENKMDEAKSRLRTLLSTLVVTKTSIPLPTTRALIMLEAAEKLVENEERDESEDKELASYLKEARNQLKLGEALGYGDHDFYEPLYEQIDMIEDKIKAKNSGKGWFDKIKDKISSAL